MEVMKRIVGWGAWLAAVVLTIYLVREFTHDQNLIIVGVAGLAIVISAFGLVFARDAWGNRDYAAVLLGLVMWGAGVLYLTMTELGYWSGAYEQRYALYQRQQEDDKHEQSLNDTAWRALTTGAVPKSPEQVKAEMKIKKLDPIFSRTKSCKDVTITESRTFCGEFFALEAELAKAMQREKLEVRLTENKPASSSSTVMNVFANAEILARRFGGNERGWSDFLIFSGWLVLVLVRDAGLIVAHPIRKRAKDEPDDDPRMQPVPEVEPVSAEVAAVKAEKKVSRPKLVVNNPPLQPAHASIENWKEEYLIEAKGKKVTSLECWQSYLDYCTKLGTNPQVKNQSWFGRKLDISEDRRKGEFEGIVYLDYRLKPVEKVKVA